MAQEKSRRGFERTTRTTAKKKSKRPSTPSKKRPSPSELETDRIVVDSVHGAIALTQDERRVIDTASFQRLRHLKQLGLAQFTYPNATHTRFAHSLGVLAIMSRVLVAARSHLKLSLETQQELRLAALLHDIGHYPYSHLMERVDDVILTEEAVDSGTTPKKTLALHAYPDHEEVGSLIVANQPDLISAIGDEERAKRITDIFTRGATADPQLSKLIHSSLDMDRLDYLLRDAQAAGVPYGSIDLEYLLNNLQTSPTGMVGIRLKALTAAEHFLFARYFMYKTVYYHKTTFGLEETCRQLIRRCRETGRYDMPADGGQLRELVKTDQLYGFTDRFVDEILLAAAKDSDPVISRLSETILFRRPPRLLREEQVLIDDADEESKRINRCTVFLNSCRERLGQLSSDCGIELGRFLIAKPQPLRLEKRGSSMPVAAAKKEPSEKEDELIKVFVDPDEDPRSLVDIPQSLLHHCGNQSYRMVRLYVVEEDLERVQRLREEVQLWAPSP